MIDPATENTGTADVVTTAVLNSPVDETPSWDSLALDPVQVEKGMWKEINTWDRWGIFEKVPRQQAQGKKKLTGTWVKKQKTPDEVRCRYCAREYATGAKTAEHFAATPTSSSEGVVDQIATSRRMIVRPSDVSTAFTHAIEEGEVYLEPPQIWLDANPGDWVWKLNNKVYGERDAARGWEDHLSWNLIDMGFKRLVSDPCLYRHAGRDMIHKVHIDDGKTLARSDSDLDWFFNELRSREIQINDDPSQYADDGEYEYVRAQYYRRPGGAVSVPAERYIEESLEAYGLS